MVTRTRKMSRLGWLVLALGASWSLLGGCGGGSHSGAVTNRGTGQLSLKIVWPSRPVTDRLVPQAANSMVVAVFQNGHQVAITQPAIQRPQSSYQLSGVPAGFVNIVATAYPAAGGTGTPVATGTISSFQVAAGKTNQAPALSLDTTVKKITVTSIKQVLGYPDTATFTATATDSDGDTVLVAPTAWRWTASNAAVALAGNAADNTAAASSRSYGTTVITAAYTEPNPDISGTLVIAVNSRGLAASAWPKHRGGATNTGTGIGGRATSTAAWVYSSGTTNPGVLSSPVIGADGTLYVGVGNGQVAAVDGTTGSARWVATIDAGGVPVTSSPAVAADGTVLVGSHDSKLYALTGSTGATRWTNKTLGAINSSPAISDNGTVYVGCDGLYLSAVNGSTGAGVHSYWTEGAMTSAAALTTTNYIVYGSDAGYLWHTLIGASYNSASWLGNVIDESVAIAADNSVYVTSHSGYLYYCGPGLYYWSSRNQVDTTPGHWVSSPAIGPDGTVYAVGQNGLVIAASPTNLNTRWSFQMSGTPQSSPAVASDGTVYVGSGDGKLYALDGANGREIWHYQAPGATTVSSPAIGADGAVYFTTGPNVQLHKLAGS